MALDRLTLSPVILPSDEDLNKAPRLPRWTRQELLVLIQGKRVAETRTRRGLSPHSQLEPKWSSVSSYCKRHGVNRGPVQCRKRWSNLAGDFKKIKEWESQIKDEAESFWVMRNDLRRERKLPGFFDREVYDILDGGESNNNNSLALSLAPAEEVEAGKEVEEVVFDSGRTADDGLFCDDDDVVVAIDDLETAAEPTPVSATQYQGAPPPATTEGDKETSAGRSPSPEPNQGRKRKRADSEEISLQKQLIEAMERNGKLLSTQLEIQNTNSQLDREQRRDHANSLFAVLNKLADAMVRIADKL